MSSIERLAREKTPVHLDIYGAAAIPSDEGYLRKLRSDFSDLEKSGVVSYRGAVVHEKIPPIYSAHDVFIHAGSASGFNKALFEAASSGCFRMLNQDVIDLYDRVPMGAKVVVL